MKYLGVMLGQGMTFGQHIKYVTEKAETRTVALRKITRNIGGPSSQKRILLYGVIQSVILYAAPVWAEWTRYKKHRNMLISTQRKALLRVAGAYRTVSAAAIQVVTGSPPMDMLVRERDRLHRRADGHTENAKREEREDTYREWQTQWETQVETGRWTKKLIKNVKAWAKCSFRNTDYFLTQVLTGHGTFGSYTKKIKKTDTEECLYCENDDNPAHTLFMCTRWNTFRTQLEIEIGEKITERNLIEIMLESKTRWKSIHTYVKKIMTNKEKEDREHRNLLRGN